MDPYEKISYGVMLSLAFWIPISFISYQFKANTNYLIYVTVLLTTFTTLYFILRSNFKLPDLFNSAQRIKFNFFSIFNTYTAVIVFQSILVGYTSQYQSGASDALIHIAAIRNMATSENVLNCNAVLGDGTPVLITYGCNPWYLTLGIILRITQVDTALGYSSLTGIVYFLSVLAIYTLLKEISGDVIISKLGSLIFTVVSLLNWLMINENRSYALYSHWIIFPQAMVDYVLFPITLAIFIKYQFHKESSFRVLPILGLLVVTRFHPNWLLWGPILFCGILVFRSLLAKKLTLKKISNHWSFTQVGIVFFLSALIFLFCDNTSMVDTDLTPPLELWKAAGGNLLILSEHFYLYDPLTYIKNRGVYDFVTILLFWYLFKKSGGNNNELFVIYSGILTAIFVLVFNPIIVNLVVKVTGSPIPLYRAFGVVWPVLCAFSIYAVLALLKIQFRASPFIVATVIMLGINVSLIYLNRYTPFLMAVYENHGRYYSTSKSAFLEPFSTFRTLAPGRIAIRTPLSGPTAAFSNLDPITTQEFRSKSLADWRIADKENDALLLFNKSYDELISIINRRKIRYIVIRKTDLYAQDNFRKFPKLIHFKAHAGTDEIWEINSTL